MMPPLPPPAGCPGQPELVQRYLDDDLSPPQRQIFETHLEACAACQTHLRELQALFAELAVVETGPLAPPPHLTEAVMAALPPQDESAAAQTSWPGRLVLALEALLGLGLLAWLWPWFSIWLTQVNPVSEMDALHLSLSVLSLSGWLEGNLLNLQSQGQLWWQTVQTTTEAYLPPGLTLGLGLVLGLVWLLGNGVLLKNPSASESPYSGGHA